MGLFMLTLVSSKAAAQDLPTMTVPAAIKSVGIDTAAKPLAAAVQAATSAVRTASGAVLQARPAQTINLKLGADVATEAAWLRNAGWPLYALVDRYGVGAPLSDEANCIATAVYFEAQGESLEGQLAVAKVIMNRAASGKYPTSWCAVVKQPAQFSFVRHGAFPWVDVQSDAWRKAQGITRLAVAKAVPCSLSDDVLWYHANYVAPSWGRRLNFEQKIGQHLFYRS
jgi:spore germination cell wall hydrolase CwlJ-like protein